MHPGEWENIKSRDKENGEKGSRKTTEIRDAIPCLFGI